MQLHIRFQRFSVWHENRGVVRKICPDSYTRYHGVENTKVKGYMSPFGKEQNISGGSGVTTTKPLHPDQGGV